MSYAEGTTVSVDKTRSEIERVLRRSGALTVIVETGPTFARVAFSTKERRVVFMLTMPDRTAKRFTHVPGSSWRERTVVAADRAYAAECRRLWRSLLLVIKAKLESVSSGIESFDQAFLANIVVPAEDGLRTVGDRFIPALRNAYERGTRMPPLLGAG